MDEQNRNLILATVLSFLVILVWYTLIAPPPVPVETAAPAGVTASEGQTAAAGQTSTGTAAAVPGQAVAEAAGALAADSGAAADFALAPRVTIDTPRLSGSISLLGGRIDDLSLKDYRVALDKPDNVRLLAPVGTEEPGAKPYYAAFGYIPAGTGAAPALPDTKSLWRIEAGDTLAPGRPVTLSHDNGAGLVFHRTYEVDENFLFTLTERIENRTGQPVRLQPWGVIARHGQPGGLHMWVLHEGAVRMSDGRLDEETYSAMTKLDPVDGEGPAAKVEVVQDGWTAITDKYWMTALIPPPGTPFTSVVKYVPGDDIFQTETRMPVLEVPAGGEAASTTMLFAGAKEWESIRGYEKSAGIKGFVDSIDWGWFFFLTKPMFWLLHWLHGLIGNMGWAIIALTFVIKTLVFPLARKSYISMARMKELQPEMEALKERVGGDRQKMQAEMMALYKREKVNPASGCLPILIQIPIFFSLYKVIVVTIELYHQPWIGWIRDLSAPDPTSILNLFGLLPFATPEQGSILYILSLGVLPIILGITMWLQAKLNPAPTDPTQAAIFAWMPWIFMFMLGGFASGLVLYWIANNLITFAQQYTIMSMHGKRPDIFGNIRAARIKPPPEAKPK
ncbi:MAG: membrane protein insertase YidC [Paracoccaceae bacterium]